MSDPGPGRRTGQSLVSRGHTTWGEPQASVQGRGMRECRLVWEQRDEMEWAAGQTGRASQRTWRLC